MTKKEKVTLSLPAGLKQRARAKAILENTSLSQVVTKFLEDWVQDAAPEPEEEGPPEE